MYSLLYLTRPQNAELPLAELKALLAKVGLSHLAAHEGVDQVVNWDDQLSLGEQQRLAMARLFQHRPKFAVLDECTSGVSSSMEAFFYEELQRMEITYITICHRPVLKAYHTQGLHLIGEGTRKYVLSDIEPLPKPREAACSELSVPVKPPKEASDADSARSALSKLRRVLRLVAIMLPGTLPRLAGLLALVALRTAAYEAIIAMFPSVTAGIDTVTLCNG